MPNAHMFQKHKQSRNYNSLTSLHIKSEHQKSTHMNKVKSLLKLESSRSQRDGNESYPEQLSFGPNVFTNRITTKKMPY